MLRAGLLLLLALTPQDEEPPKIEPVKPGARGSDMDYGPFLSASIARTRYRKDADLHALKGIAIRLAEDVTVCFDTDLLRYSAGWTGGFLDLAGTHLVTSKGSIPTTMKGTLEFSTRSAPGWLKRGDSKDPRPAPHGPLPRDWAHYKGLYVHGRRTVLAYTVGDSPVLDLPGFSDGCFTRRLKLGPSKTPRTFVVAEAPVPCQVEGARLSGEKTLLAEVPASDSDVAVTVAVGKGDLASALRAAAAEPDPSELCKGGPLLWDAPIITRGVPGKEDGPYAVDTLTLPDDNPWKSWLRLTGVDFFPDGRAAVCTWSGDVWIVSGIDAPLENLSWKRFATGLYEPLGLRVAGGQVYALGRDQITRLHDLNGDGEADFHENFNNDTHTMANYHAFAFELHTDREGNFYYASDGHRVDSSVPLHGCIVKVSKDGKTSEVLATGLRAPNGMSVGPADEITCSDNQGNWTPASRLNWVKPGGFYGYVPHSGRKEAPKEQDPPLCWLPHSIDNSSGGQIWVTSDAWGPLKGHLLHTSYGTASLFHVLVQRIGEGVQGGVVKFPLSFGSGIMRGRFSPADGQLYLAGLRGWQTTGARDGGLQRVRYTGKPLRTIAAMRVTKSGLELDFTEPLDRASAVDLENWGAQWWNYAWTEKYGSPDLWVSNPKKQGREPLELKSATLSADGRTVTLEVPGIRPVMQMLVRARVNAADGAPVSADLYLTINRLP